jgi:hypothetical protein
LTPEERFAAIVPLVVAMPSVSPPGPGGGFGSGALKVSGKIFAMVVRDRLVVKLPGRRVDGLVEAGQGTRFDANKGKPMKEWFSVAPESSLDWTDLVLEALEFVGGSGPP